ncbi:MAG TPA: DUF4337 domain-containing protein [bacterium]|jgi:hypothetical protein
MADEPKAAWLNWLAITTIIFSACATLSTFKGGGYSTKSVLAQTSASNQWAYFQSKSVKQHTCELQRDAFEMQLLQVSDSGIAHTYQTRLADLQKDIDRYNKEKNQISDSAKALEQAKVDFQQHSGRFGLAVVYLQVAIMFSALAALIKKKYVWVLGVVVGAFGLLNFVNGILATMK